MGMQSQSSMGMSGNMMGGPMGGGSNMMGGAMGGAGGGAVRMQSSMNMVNTAAFQQRTDNAFASFGTIKN